MNSPDYEALIVGGGLSGLSLAAHLAVGGWAGRRVLIVDDVDQPHAASWGFWSARPGLLDNAVTSRYRQLRIHAGGTGRVLDLGRYRYQVVHRAALERTVHELTDRSAFEFAGGRVEWIGGDANRAEILLDGRPITARWVFDSVGHTAVQPPVLARLAFTGWTVQAADPVFDPTTPVLFDFRTPQGSQARFLYVRPEDRYRALVELTAFVPRGAAPPGAGECAEALARYLAEVLGCAGYQLVGRESGLLALRGPGHRRIGDRMLTIGAPAGLVKASTGYGYPAIQRDSAAIAGSLARYGHPFALPRPAGRYRLLDAIFLAALEGDPSQLERAFARLFDRNPAQRVLRFLDEQTGVPDELRLIASLRPGPYLRATTRVMARAAGAGR